MGNVSTIWFGKYELRRVLPLHHHSFFQLLLPFSGPGVARLGEELVSFSGGNEALLIPPGLPHTVHSVAAPAAGTLLPFHSFDFKFTVEDPALHSALVDLPYHIHLEENHRLRALSERILEESRGGAFGSEQVIDATLETLLVYLVRAATGTATGPRGGAEAEAVAMGAPAGNGLALALAFIHAHTGEDISLDDIVAHGGMGKSALIAAFKRQYGITPIKYVNALRINQAKRLLRGGAANVSEVAFAVGFQSLHYFSRTFKEKEGISPGAYRARYRDSYYFLNTGRLPEEYDHTLV